MGKRKDSYYVKTRKWKKKQKQVLTQRFPVKELNDCNEGLASNDKNCIIHQENPNLEVSKDKEQLCETEVAVKGFRIIDFGYLCQQLQDISQHNSPLGCNYSTLKLTGEHKKGFHSDFFFICKMCNTKLTLENCRKPTSSKELTLNENIVSSFISIGTGYAGLEQVTASLEIPCMSEYLYAKCHAKVCELWELAKEKSMNEAAKEEYKLAIENGDINADGTPMIQVVVDGCWSKRSYRKNYTALSGAAVIIGYRTKRVLYMAVKNKYCMVCARAENQNIEIPEHVCFKNYKGSSSGMESVAIVEGFKSSLTTYGLIYSKLIADGDSSTYKNILEAKPYGNLIVEKIECTNHLLRNFCTKLDDLTKNANYNLKSRKILAKNILRLRRSVKGAVEYMKSQNISFDEKVMALKVDLFNAPNHVFGDHSSCKPYFCKNIITEEENYVPDMKSNSIFAAILKIMCRLVNNAKSLLYSANSNIAEVFNSVIAKYIGGKRVNYSLRQSYSGRCAGSVISFNSKKPQTYICRKILMRSPNPIIKRLEIKRYTKRLASAKSRLMKSYSTKKKNNSVDKDYGDACQKPDLSEADFNFAKAIHMEKIRLSDKARQSLERRTILQSESIEWHQERKMRLTASVFGKICKRGLIKCGPLVKSLRNDNGGLSHVKAIQHGKEHEPIAIKQLDSILKAEEKTNSSIMKCGLFVDPELPFLAASPDGLFQNDAIIEIKCPYSATGMSVEEGIEKKKISFWKQDKSGNVELNKNHNWYYQAQGQLHVTQRKMCIFAVWTDINMRIERIQKDDEFWKTKMENKLKTFYLDCLLPEIIDSRLERVMEIREPEYITRAIEKKEAARSKRKSDTNNYKNNSSKRKKS